MFANSLKPVQLLSNVTSLNALIRTDPDVVLRQIVIDWGY